MAGLWLLDTAPARADVHLGDAFPALSSAGLTGAALPETSGRVVLVDFWASWCAPCKASFPAYRRLDADYAPRGLVIVAISVDRDPRAYESFVRRFNPSFPVEDDLEQKFVSLVQVPTMPTSYLIDRKGRVRFIHPGFHGSDTEALLRKEIETLLAEAAS